MIILDKLLTFSGRVTNISTPSFKCTISTNKESLFKGLSTIIFEPHAIDGIRACVKIIYSSALNKAERHQYHEFLCETLDAAGENGISLSLAVQEVQTLFMSRGISKEFINVT
jgi:hypothetical protein